MKLIKIFFLICGLFLLESCSNNEEQLPTDRLEVETMPLAEILNADGTKYVLHNSYLTHRTSDNKVLHKIDIIIPKPLLLDIGYGQKKEVPFRFSFFTLIDNRIALGVSPMLFGVPIPQQEEVSRQVNSYIYFVDADFKNLAKKEVQGGLLHYENGLFISYISGLSYILYDKNLQVILKGKTTEELETYAFGAHLAKIASNFYLVLKVRKPSVGYFDTIVNLNDGTSNVIDYLETNEIIKEHFAAEKYLPHLDSQSMTLVPGEQGYLKVTYNFTLYDGSKREVFYNYDVNGKVIR